MQPNKYQALYGALLAAPEYFGLDDKLRAQCKAFAVLMASSEGSSDLRKVEKAYQGALVEARQLVASGALTVKLPEIQQEGSPKPAEASAPPADEPDYPAHPVADIFPMMPDEALDKMAEDMKENGQQVPIIIHEGRTIDGRNRKEACRRAGIKPIYEEWQGKGSVVAWILSMNVHRRHLNDQQRAVIAARVKEILSEQAKERSAQNLRQNRDGTENRDPDSRTEGSSAKAAATLLNVSKDATSKATKVLKSGHKSLVDAVTEGRVSLDAAAKVAELPQSRQSKIVAEGKVKEVAKKARQDKAAKNGNGKGSGNSAVSPSDNVKGQSAPAEAKAPAESKQVPRKAVADEPASTTKHPLMGDVHDAIEKMVRAGSDAGQPDHVTKLLRSIIEFCSKQRTKFVEAPKGS